MKDIEAKNYLVNLIKNIDSYALKVFLILRIKLLPLDTYYQKMYLKNKIIEIGCGHGLVSAYLALRLPNNKIIGLDPDIKRISFAKKNFSSIKNLEFLNEKPNIKNTSKADVFIFIGVLYLMSDSDLKNMLKILRINLNKDGFIYVSEIKKERIYNIKYIFHLIREYCLKYINFTKGSVIKPRNLAKLNIIFQNESFFSSIIININVPYHSTIDIIYY